MDDDNKTTDGETFSHPLKYDVTAHQHNIRCDRWLKQHFSLAPTGMIHKWIRSGQVRIDGSRCRAMQRLKQNQVIRVPPFAMSFVASAPEGLDERTRARLVNMALGATEDVILIDKPPGLAVQGGSGIHESLDSWLARITPNEEDKTSLFWATTRLAPVLVHRLDKDTSGILIVARDRDRARVLMPLFQSGQIHKAYLAITHGSFLQTHGEVTSPILREAEAGHYDTRELPARTRYHCLSRSDDCSLILLAPSSGRKHQLRIHCARIGHGIRGDRRHGIPEDIDKVTVPRLLLHAFAIEVPSPYATGLRTAPVPSDFDDCVRSLGLILPSAADLIQHCKDIWAKELN